jgi:serine/threonine protein phosphatase PrpC
MSKHRGFRFDAVVNTHKGNVRNLNEDSLLSRSEAGLWVVADGMGGHEAGEVASQLIVSSLESLPQRAYISDFVDDVEDTLLLVNQKLRTHSIEKLNGLTIGSTVTCLILREAIGVVLWVGDSRLYRLREGRLEQLTKDHSEVQAQIDMGVLTPEQAENSSIKNMLSRAIGAFDELDVDVNAFPVQADDLFLLCTDGLYNELSSGEIEQMLKYGHLDKISEKLMQSCLSHEAKDNVSFIVVKASA